MSEPTEIGRARMFTCDRVEFVLEGVDDADRKCWRTYTGTVTVRGELHMAHFTAYSPPNDWNELGLPGEP